MTTETHSMPIATIPCPYCRLITPEWRPQCIHCQRHRLCGPPETEAVVTRRYVYTASRGHSIQRLMPTVVIVLALIVGASQEARAEPSWARKYKADCTLCHTIYPRLNRTGYEFKRLGYRFPAEVEKRTSTVPVALVSSHAAPSSAETNYKPAPWTDQAAAGKALVSKFNCSTCHQVEGAGGRIAPSLDGVGGRRSWEFIAAHITDPVQHAQQYTPEFRLGGELMPKISASPEQISQMAAYLLTLPYRSVGVTAPHPPAGGAGSFNPAYVPAPVTQTAEGGRKLYFSSGCSACHSIGGQGSNVGPALDGVGARRSPVWLTRHVANPEKHIEAQPQVHQTTTTMMPPTELTTTEVAQIVDFLLTTPAGKEQATDLIRENRVQDYFAVAYLPAVQWERTSGENSRTFDKRGLNLYAAGTLGSHLSFFLQPTPATDATGFLNHFEMMQGALNFGGAKNFVQVRFGQIFNLLNAGFAGSDRSITSSIPLIFQPANGFNPGELGRGASAEFTMKGLTTFKVFTASQTQPDELAVIGADEDTEVPEARRSRLYGFAIEKVIGSRGLSGLQFQYAGGNTPIVQEGQFLPALRFQRYSVFANKTFQDKRNVERLNLICGVSALRDDRILGLEARSSRGYGFFLEANWIPVKRLGLVTRFDQLRPTTLISSNTLRAETVALLYDVTRYTRMSFEYQHGDRLLPANSYRLGWQLNF